MSAHRCDTGWFDRSICPEPCGMMHSFCTTCARLMDACPHEEIEHEARKVRLVPATGEDPEW